LLANLPDKLLYEYGAFIGDASFVVMDSLKTQYRERFINNVILRYKRYSLVNRDPSYRLMRFGAIFRFVYFALSPREFLELIEKLPFGDIPKAPMKVEIEMIAAGAERDGFTKWAKLVREEINKRYR
jgi:hypothetical protein